MHRLVYTRQFLDQFDGLPETLRDAVERTIDRLALDAELGKPLLGRLAGFRAIRIGNYRLLYTIEGSGTRRQVVLRSFRHRALAYGRRRHR